MKEFGRWGGRALVGLFWLIGLGIPGAFAAGRDGIGPSRLDDSVAAEDVGGGDVRLSTPEAGGRLTLHRPFGTAAAPWKNVIIGRGLRHVEFHRQLNAENLVPVDDVDLIFDPLPDDPAIGVSADLGTEDKPFSSITFGRDIDDIVDLQASVHAADVRLGGTLRWRDPSGVFRSDGIRTLFPRQGSLVVDGNFDAARAPILSDSRHALRRLEWRGGESRLRGDIHVEDMRIDPGARLILADGALTFHGGRVTNRGSIVFSGMTLRSADDSLIFDHHGVGVFFADTHFPDRNFVLHSRPRSFLHVAPGRVLSLASRGAIVNEGTMLLDPGAVLRAHLRQRAPSSVFWIRPGDPVVIDGHDVVLEDGVLILEILDSQRYGKVTAARGGLLSLSGAQLHIQGNPPEGVFEKVFAAGLLRDGDRLEFSDDQLRRIAIKAPYSSLSFFLRHGADGIDLHAVREPLPAESTPPPPWRESGHIRWVDSSSGPYGIFVSIPQFCRFSAAYSRPDLPARSRIIDSPLCPKTAAAASKATTTQAWSDALGFLPGDQSRAVLGAMNKGAIRPYLSAVLSRIQPKDRAQIVTLAARQMLALPVAMKRTFLLDTRRLEAMVQGRIEAREVSIDAPAEPCRDSSWEESCVDGSSENPSSADRRSAFPVWTRGQGYYFSRSGYRGYGYGDMIGLDAAFGSDQLLIGATVGIMASQTQADDRAFRQDQSRYIPFGIYGSYRMDRSNRVDLALLFGYRLHHSRHYVLSGEVSGSAPSWSYGLALGWKRDFPAWSWADLSVRGGISWFRWDFDSYDEKGFVPRRMNFDDLDVLSLSLEAKGKRRFDFDSHRRFVPLSVIPAIRVRLAHDVLNQRLSGRAEFIGSGREFAVRGEDISAWSVSVGAEMALHLSRRQSISPIYEFSRQDRLHSHGMAMEWRYLF